MYETFVRPKNMKTWEMCKWVDDNIHRLKEESGNPELEEKLLSCLYWIYSDLSHKKRMFRDFEFYDSFCSTSASNTYLAFRKKVFHAGELDSRHQIIKPIKSCLNYIKSTLYPSKVEFEKREYRQVYNSNLGDNTDKLNENLRENIKQSYRKSFEDLLEEFLPQYSVDLYDMLYKESPFRKDEVIIKNIFISIMLNLINQITITNNLKKKVVKCNKTDKDACQKILNLYVNQNNEILLWHLSENMTEYIRIMLIKAKRLFTDQLATSRNRLDLSEEMLDNIMATAFPTYCDSNNVKGE